MLQLAGGCLSDMSVAGAEGEAEPRVGVAPGVEVGALVDSIIEPISDEKLYEVVNDGPTGYRGLREYLEARKAERDRIRALRDGPPAQIVFDDTTEEL